MAENSSTVHSQYVPETVITGEPFVAVIIFQNTGTTAWDYHYGVKSVDGSLTWGLNQIELLHGEEYSPGAYYYSFLQLTAPVSPGNYVMQWQMFEHDVGAFGELTPPISVTAVVGHNDSEFVTQSIPAAMEPGAQYQVSVSFRNTGTKAWRGSALSYNLSSKGADENLHWGLNRVDLSPSESIPPGEEKTVEVQPERDSIDAAI